MPICQICHAREASLFFKRIVGGETTELQVCRQCAAENGGIKIDVGNLLAGLSKLGMGSVEKNQVDKVCEQCGLTLDEFNKSGLMGCSHCYETFSEHVEGLLKKVHGNVKHQGKIPVYHAYQPHEVVGEKTPETVEKLKTELKAAIMEEAYERAAVLRDRIHVMEHDEEVQA